MQFSVADIMESGLTSKESEKQPEIHSKGDVIEFVETLEEETEETEGILNFNSFPPNLQLFLTFSVQSYNSFHRRFQCYSYHFMCDSC